MVNPVVTAPEFINAEFTGRKLTSCEIRENHRNVTTTRVHGIFPVAAALPIPAGMHVHVRDQAQTQFSAFSVYQMQEAAVKFDDAVIEAMRVDVVVKEKFSDNANVLFDVAKQKSAALTSPIRTPPQFCNTFTPDPRVAQDFGRAVAKPVNDRRD